MPPLEAELFILPSIFTKYIIEEAKQAKTNIDGFK